MAQYERPNLSASEINQYLYCPFQWYYKRVIGTKQLMALARERNERLGLRHTAESHLKKGLIYHARYEFNHWMRLGVKILALLMITLVAAVVLYYGFLS